MADVFGQLFTKEDGERVFGPIVFSVPLDSKIVSDYGKRTDIGPYLMFGIINNQPIVYSQGRKELLNKTNTILNDGFVLHVYSISMVLELLEKGDDTLYLEQREAAFTLSSGSMLLEMSSCCPPMC
ncbi:MAG: hypothetical protein R6W90_15600 [Ignavibacteriaceae bacterium]